MKSENLEGVMDFMNNIKIIGLGPGHKDYILPIAQNLIKESQIIISGKRNIENMGMRNKNRLVLLWTWLRY